ncbi:MAG: Transcriptional regulatory protein ZraR [Verrucomicrobiae bacterium]|nr:Transcriptional regulatory protein ZraR [Verrucomicrobiae bacterium]
MPRAKILVIDSDATWTLTLSELLIPDNYEVFSANSAPDAFLLLEVHSIDLLIAEVNLPGVDGTALLEQLRQMFPQSGILIHTAKPSISQAVHATRLGVLDYIEKCHEAVALSTLRDKIRRTIQQHGTYVGSSQPADPRSRGVLASPVQGFYGILSQNDRMRDIFELIQTIADSTANVLIHGETGTGKELVARAVHEASVRHGKPFVTLDCSALARELLESELFGHEKGAFTGATDRHIGRFERANGGTFFLDEVANIDLNVQAKLLRVLQSRNFERVGGTKPISVDVRIVSATNKPLEELIGAGNFREDLYHRLNVVQIDLPPLRHRSEDIPLLAMEFLRRFARQNSKDMRGFTDTAIATLNGYHWPGNVRELENVILQAVVLAKSALIDRSDLPKRILDAPVQETPAVTLAGQLGEPEKQIVLNALRQHGGNIKRAAAMLDISRTTLYAKLKKYDIDPDAVR